MAAGQPRRAPCSTFCLTGLVLRLGYTSCGMIAKRGRRSRPNPGRRADWATRDVQRIEETNRRLREVGE